VVTAAAAAVIVVAVAADMAAAVAGAGIKFELDQFLFQKAAEAQWLFFILSITPFANS
jgi:hypothetical protein